MKPSIFKTILFLAVVAVIGVGAYFYLVKPPQSGSPLGGDADSHECLASAGYIWCESKDKCLRAFEEFCPDEVTKIVRGLNAESMHNLEYGGETKLLWLVEQDDIKTSTNIDAVLYSAQLPNTEEYLKLEEYMNSNYEIDNINASQVLSGAIKGYYVDYMACMLRYAYPLMVGDSMETAAPQSENVVVSLTCGYFNKNDIPQLIATQAITDILLDEHKLEKNEVVVEITKFQENFAAGSIAFYSEEKVGGGLFLARKVDGKWTLSYEGNGSVDCADLKNNQGFPDEILQPNFCE